MALVPQSDTTAVDDATAMQHALDCARRGAKAGEVPVGAVIVQGGRVIGTGYNTPIADHDPSAHAEIKALREAARQLGNYRLDGCTLYVTLEPCTMCAGAILNARVGRVVFAASDPKAGAAGSVIDLFADARLNHQTQVEGGLLAESSRALLQAFFRARRVPNSAPLREDALRTPEAAFRSLSDYPWQPRYSHQLPSLGGLRLHRVDAGPSTAPCTWLCLHGCQTWSYAYRHLINALVAHNQRVVAPDLPGFGKSDKPKRARVHTFDWYIQVLLELVEHLDLQHLIIMGYGLGARLAVRLPAHAPSRFVGAAFLGTAETADYAGNSSLIQAADSRVAEQRTAEKQAWTAPFPDAGFKAALRASASVVSAPSDDGVEFLKREWRGRTVAIRSASGSSSSAQVAAVDPEDIPSLLAGSVTIEPPAWLSAPWVTGTVVAKALRLLASD